MIDSDILAISVWLLLIIRLCLGAAIRSADARGPFGKAAQRRPAPWAAAHGVAVQRLTPRFRLIAALFAPPFDAAPEPLRPLGGSTGEFRSGSAREPACDIAGCRRSCAGLSGSVPLRPRTPVSVEGATGLPVARARWRAG